MLRCVSCTSKRKGENGPNLLRQHSEKKERKYANLQIFDVSNCFTLAMYI